LTVAGAALILFASTGCATRLPPPVPVAHGPGEVRVVAVDGAPVVWEEPDRPSTEDPERVILQANRVARVQPTREAFERGMQRFTFREHSVYEVRAAPEEWTVIELSPGEKLKHAILADTVRWTYVESEAGEGDGMRKVFMLQPHQPHLKNSLVITSNWGLKRIALRSHPSLYLASVSWVYPDRKKVVKPLRPASATRYTLRVLADPEPPWMVRRVWDDGVKTYMVFDERMTVTERPSVYVRSAQGLEPVNEVQKGHTFEIPRLARAWQVQVGDEDEGQVIRIDAVEEK
jgi:type IV secretory pathway VirB9-like protein